MLIKNPKTCNKAWCNPNKEMHVNGMCSKERISEHDETAVIEES